MRSLVFALALFPVSAHACEDGETRVFSCGTDTKEEVSICQGKETITYRYGKPGAPEITVPATNTSLVWQHGESPRAGNLDIFYFRDGTTRYAITHTASATDPADADAHITVSSAGKEDVFIECATGISFNRAILKSRPSEITEQRHQL